jgi:hypothetical protein
MEFSQYVMCTSSIHLVNVKLRSVYMDKPLEGRNPSYILSLSRHSDSLGSEREIDRVCRERM